MNDKKITPEMLACADLSRAKLDPAFFSKLQVNDVLELKYAYQNNRISDNYTLRAAVILISEKQGLVIGGQNPEIMLSGLVRLKYGKRYYRAVLCSDRNGYLFLRFLDHNGRPRKWLPVIGQVKNLSRK